MGAQLGSRRILAIMPTDSHGGCEYNALSALKYFRETHGFDIVAAFPMVEGTKLLVDICRSNDIETVEFGATFAGSDDAKTAGRQRAVTRDLVGEIAPWVVFIPMPWPKRGQGVIAGCADIGVPTVVKFALVPPEISPKDFVLGAAKSAVTSGRQVWFANSRFSAELIERHWGLPPRSVDSFHVGAIGLARLMPEKIPDMPVDTLRAAVREEFGWPAECRIAVTVARLSTQKGYDKLMAVVPRLAMAHEDLRFLWVGHGELEVQAKAWVEASDLGGKVAISGFRDDVRRLLKASDLFILPTVYEGGCSQALLEAMEESLPIVVTDTSAVQEVAHNGRNALLVPVGNTEKLAEAIETLLTQPEFAAELGASAKADAVTFSAETSFEETLARLQRAVSVTGIVPAEDVASHKQWPLISEVKGRIWTPDAAAFAGGWHQLERLNDGQPFRWMSDLGFIYSDVLIDEPVLFELNMINALTPEAWSSAGLVVDGCTVETVDMSRWKIRWKATPTVAATAPAKIRLSAKSARARDLSPDSNDTREMSICVFNLGIALS